jgi:DNA (cytosine-5)-methyltransferase 1
MVAVDLFAGAGGWTEGARQAGIDVTVCANHWPLAVETHSANHPDTVHLCQDVSLIDATSLPAHDLLIASPACQGHSLARGKERPHHDGGRSTAWAVVDIAEVCRPRLLAVENVPEFVRWPLFDLWRQALERLGYGLTLNVLDAADFGVAQNRRRLFILGELDGQAPEIEPPQLPTVPASSVVDFNRGSWTPIRKPGRAPATIRRIETARAQGMGKRFLAPYYGSGSGLTGRSLDRPLGTVTTRDRYAVIDGDRMRMLTVEEYKAAMGFPEDYYLAGNRGQQIFQLGNAVCPPVAREVLRQLAA